MQRSSSSSQIRTKRRGMECIGTNMALQIEDEKRKRKIELEARETKEGAKL